MNDHPPGPSGYDLLWPLGGPTLTGQRPFPHPTIRFDPFDPWLPDLAADTLPQLEVGTFGPFRSYRVTSPDPLASSGKHPSRSRP